MSELEIPIVRVGEESQIPRYAVEGDAGVDLVSSEEHEILPLTRATVPTGIKIAIPKGMCGLVLPRSGLASRCGITLLNAPGLIDSGYRGEIKVVMYNSDAQSSFKVKIGDRIAQLVVVAFSQLVFRETEILGPSTRGEYGFGHTGVGSTDLGSLK